MIIKSKREVHINTHKVKDTITLDALRIHSVRIYKTSPFIPSKQNANIEAKGNTICDKTWFSPRMRV